MIIFLLRHGEAEKEPAGNDSLRKLTAPGRGQIANIAQLAKRLGAKPDLIISSPLLRAKESAEITRHVLNPEATVSIDNALEPESDPNQIFSLLARSNAASVLLVGHKPPLRDFVFASLGCTPDIEFRPGTLARIDSPAPPLQGEGTLIWLLPQLNQAQSAEQD
jgi:phosphohistidine phosphatase